MKSCLHCANSKAKIDKKLILLFVRVIRENMKMAQDSGMVQNKKIYELTELYDEQNGLAYPPADRGKNEQAVVRNGRADDHPIHDLTDVIEEAPSVDQINDLVLKRVTGMIEKIVREAVPDIAERVIREEMEKLKRDG